MHAEDVDSGCWPYSRNRYNISGTKSRSPPTLLPRTRKSRRVEPVAWGSEKTSATPKKQNSMLYDNPLSKLNSAKCRVHQQTKQCSGLSLHCEPTGAAMDPNTNPKGTGSRNNCFECGTKTSWYCLGCHHWLCMDRWIHFGGEEMLLHKEAQACI